MIPCFQELENGFISPRSERNTAITPCILKTAFCNLESKGASEDTAHITSLDTKGTERVDKIVKIPNSELSTEIFFISSTPGKLRPLSSVSLSAGMDSHILAWQVQLARIKEQK